MDTRGFNDTRKYDDKDILLQLLNLLLMGKYKDLSMISGIIYIHDANDTARLHYKKRMEDL